MLIREVEFHDMMGLLRLYTQLHDNKMPSKSDSLIDMWNKILQDENHHIIIGIEDNNIVSSCVLIVVPNFTHEQRPYAFIENVITHRDYRCRGFASKILHYAKSIATENNCYKIMLMTGSHEASTLRFYERAGYNKQDKTAFIKWL